MVRKDLRGVSLMTALLLITIVMVVAATMAGVFTMNMNITQRVSNGSIALSEAEAGIAEVLYQITRDENIEGDKNAENPKVKWGTNGETIRATITPGMNENEAYHLVTFDPGSSFPHSTNNTYLNRDTGSMGRTIPDGMIHIVSTGYCKGQYRTVECLVEKPPFPFGLATSGPIVSRDPIKVKGVSSLAEYDPDEEEGDRPGHLLCNAPEGIEIGTADGLTTEISGFVKSSGPAVIAQPAVVQGGVRTFTDESTIAEIKIEDFNIQGQPGVVSLLDSQYDQAQEMDVMYHYSGSHLQYMSEVQLKQAMLYVEGDLTIHGPVYGEGLIVVDGNATFKSGTALAGTNKMAVLASGNITIEGNNNYFMGLVYSEGNLNASNITIVGNTVVNSADSGKGRADLANVTVVSNEETADMTITITSSTQLIGGNAQGDMPFPLMVNMGNFGSPGPGDEGWIMPGNTPETFRGKFVEALWQAAVSGGEFPNFEPAPYQAPGTQGLWTQLGNLYQLAADAKLHHDAYEEQKALVAGMDPTDDGYEDAVETLETLEGTSLGYQAENEQKFADAEWDLINDVFRFKAAHTDENGSGTDGIADMDIVIDKRFNLNEYHPESEKIKVAFWRVYPRRM